MPDQWNYLEKIQKNHLCLSDALKLDAGPGKLILRVSLNIS